MPLIDSKDDSAPGCQGGLPNPSTRAARLSFALALTALGAGVVCIMCGRWGPGLILVFAAVAGAVTAWQVRRRI